MVFELYSQLTDEPMSFQELMLTYGYPILFFGVMLESEAFLILAAYLAHRGYFSLPLVIGVAALSSLLITQLYFYLGQRYGGPFVAKRPRWQQRVDRVGALAGRYGAGLVLGYRALYGLRGVIPAVLGLTNYGGLRFLVLNAAGAILWAVVVALAGNRLAKVGEETFDWLRSHEPAVIMLLLSLGVVWGLYQLYRQPKLSKSTTDASVL